jgi:Domain of unknown function (DUF4395)
MDERAPDDPQADARAARFELAAIAVILLGAFVFKTYWIVPGLAVVVAFGLGFGPRANVFLQVYQLVVGDRLKRSAAPSTDPATEPTGDVRRSELFAVVALTLATVLFVLGVDLLAWPVTLVEAGICALEATTGVSVETAIIDRLRGRTGR